MSKIEVERTSNYRTLNIDTLNFEHFEHDGQILRPNFEQARPNIELLSETEKAMIEKSTNIKIRRKKWD